MTTNRVRNNLGKGKGEALSLQKYFCVLLIAFVFVLGMLVGGTADAAKVASEEISRTATIELRAKKGEDKPTKTVPIKMTVKLENIDITAYAKYTAEIQKNDKYKRIVFAKAAPGSKVTITVEPAPIPGMLSKPARNMNYSESVNYYNHKKIGTLKELTSLGKESSFYNNYTIPNDVEEVTATVDLTYHVGMEVGKDMKSSTGTYRKEPALARHYYIFTSDTACKKAFELMTASSVTGAISNVLGGDKKPNAKSDSKDSGGMEMVIGVVIGVAVLGAVGYGAYRMFGKGGGSKGNGAGNYNNPAGGPQPMQRPSAPMPNSYGPQPMQRPGAPMSNSYGQQPMQRPGAPSPNSYGQQPMQRPGAPMPNSYGQQPMQRPGAPMPNSYGSQQTQRPGTTMNNTGRPQPKQRPGAATRNASGQRQAQRPGGAAKRSAAENVTYCKQCGAPMRSGSHFCKNCGARNTLNICPSCGAKLEPGDMFCGNCGMKV